MGHYCNADYFIVCIDNHGHLITNHEDILVVGYKMAVIINTNSASAGIKFYKETHLFLGVAIQRGEFDDQLRWPLKGKVTVQVYNRMTNKWGVKRQ